MVRLVSENDVFGPMEDLDSEDAADAELLRSAMQLIDPELRSSRLFQHAQREVLERFGLRKNMHKYTTIDVLT